MSNSFYNHTTYPTPNSPGSSAALRAEFDAVTAGFAKLPTLAGNGYKVAMVNAAGNALVASSALQQLAITASTLDGTPIGTGTRAAGNFTTLTANSTVNLGSTVVMAGGTIDNTIIGGTTPAAAYFTTVSANSGFTGNLTGNVTGNLTGNVTGNITGNVTGNVTATTGSSTFNDVSITGTLDMNSGTTGTITGLSTPTNSSDAATKGYVDTQDALKLSLTGGTMSGAIAMGTNRITGLGDPVNPQDAATKNYVDATAQGLDIKGSVKVATTANITLSGTQTIDGVAVIAGDRVLVKDQSTQSANGIYVVAAGAWTRATDFDTWTELPGAFTFVEQGTTNDNSGWVCTVSQGGTLGSTSITFEQFSGAGQITAGSGLTKTGNTINVITASAARIVVNADNIDLATTGVGAGTYTSVTVDLYGRVTGGTNPTTLAGYGITDAYTKSQIDTTVATLLPLAGGTMSGNIAMGNNKVTGLATPSAGTDATNKTYVDGILGSATAAATSAAAAAASAVAASNSQTAASNSQTAAATSETNAAASAAAAAASYDSFDDRYLGAKATPPTVDNDGNALVIGALYFDTTLNSMRVWTSGGWIAAGSAVNGTSQRYKYVATASQTTFTGVDANGATLAYDAGYVDVYLNGSRLDTSDFTASSGTSIVLGAACAAGDIINIVAFGTFSIATHVLKTGDTMTGTLTLNVNSSSDALRITQVGSGNALYIEDVAADATPLVVSSTGVLGIGTTTPDNITGAGIALVSNNGYYPQLVNRNTTNDANASYMVFEKDRAGAIVQNGDILGNLIFRGYDGTQYLQGAAIWSAISAAPGVNDMPADLIFGTTPDGASGISERMRITQAGNVGIGGIVPTNTGLSLAQARNLSWQWAGNGYNYANIFNQTNSASLILASGYQQSATVNGFASSVPVSWDRSAINVGSGGIRFYTDTNSTVAVGTDITPTERMRIDSSGNVLVGLTTALGNNAWSAKLQLGSEGLAIKRSDGSYPNMIYNRTADNSFWLTVQSGTYGTSYYMTGSGEHIWTNSTDSSRERMRIDSNGNLLVGTASASSLWAGTGAGNGVHLAAPYSAIQCSTNTNLYLSKASGYTASSFIDFYVNGSAKGTITTNGTTTSYNTSSDYRLKENIQPMTGALSVVSQLKPCTYTWKEDGSAGQGFIAHELQAVVPDAVHGEKDAVRTDRREISPAMPAVYDDDGNELTPATEAEYEEVEVPVYQGIDTSFLVATLTAAIQELKAINDAQAETIAAANISIENLVARVAALEGATQ